MSSAVSQICPLPQALAAMAANHRSMLLFRRGGKSEQRSHARCHADAAALAGALAARGVKAGSRVAIHGATSYEWVVTDLGCVLAGALSVAVYPSAPLARALAAAQESGAEVIFSDQPTAIAAFQDAGLTVVHLGPSNAAPAGVTSTYDLIDDARHAPLPKATTPREGPFTVVSTSGTLSEPKLFAVSATPLLRTMDMFAEIYNFGPGDRLLLYLPLSHLPQRMMLYWGLQNGLDFVLSDPVHFAADGATHAPTLHVTVPRVLEHIRRRVSAAVLSGTAPTMQDGYRSIFGPNIRSIFVGSAPTDADLIAHLIEAGLPIYEVYGTTELGMISLNTPTRRKEGTVGQPIRWGAVRLDPENGEVQVQTPTPFLYGRLENSVIVPKLWDADRFEPTGDIGRIDEDGFLHVLGRLRDFAVLPSGEKILLTSIEKQISKETKSDFCQVTLRPESRFGAMLFYTDRKTINREEIERALEELNTKLHQWERIRSYAIIGQTPTVEDGCLTETGKPRRHIIDATYSPIARWRRLGAATREHAEL